MEHLSMTVKHDFNKIFYFLFVGEYEMDRTLYDIL